MPTYNNLTKQIESFLTRLKRDKKGLNTIKNYKADLNCFATFLDNTLNKIELSKIDFDQVNEYSYYLQSNFNSENSQRRKIQTLRSFFDFLVVKNLVSNNPVRKLATTPKFLDIPRPTPIAHIKATWIHLLENSQSTTNDLSHLINLRNQVIFLLIFGGGLKISNIKNLKQKNIIIKDSFPRVMITHPTRDPYTVPLPHVMIHIFKKYRSSLRKMKDKFNIKFENLLFNANSYRILSGGLSPRGIEIILEDIRNKLEIPLTPKSLRQACIYKWLHSNENESLIKEWMGVAPSYSLDLYKQQTLQNKFNDHFLLKLYNHY